MRWIILLLLLPFATLAQRQPGGISFTPQFNFKVTGPDTTYQFFNSLATGSGAWPFFLSRAQSDARYAPMTGGGYVPYTGATTDLNLGTHNITAGTGTFTSDLYVGGQPVSTRKNIDSYGKKGVFFGDSYFTNTRATNAARGFIQPFCDGMGLIEVNNGAGGTTLEKRSPIDYQASPNMVDRISSIPTYDPSYAILVFGYGLNDMGYNGGSYSAANYITDYTTVLNGAIAKGWPVSRILLIPPPFIGAVGYASYAGITGQPAPTRARHLSFVDATKTVANTFGTLYIPLFDDQLKNDTTLLDTVAGPTKGIHPTDAGYAFIANDLIKFFGGTLFTGNRIPHPSLTPIALEVDGGGYGTNTAGDPGNLKGIFYNDGTNKAGIGESANNQEYQIYGGGSHNFYIGGVPVGGFSNTGALIKGLSTGANNILAMYNGSTVIGGFGSEFVYNGTNALNTVLYTAGNHSISLGTNASKRLTIDGAGAATFSGSLTVSGLGAGSAGNFVVNGGSGLLATRTAAQALGDLGAQALLNGTGFVKSTAGTISYDNSAYLTTAAAISTYVQLSGGAGANMTGALSNAATDGGLIFMKNGTGNVSLWSTTKGALGTGSNSDMLLYVYGNNPFVVQTNGVVRQTISGAGATTFSGSIAASNLSLGGNFTTSGAFNTTLTATGTTAVTLPTTGTLATLAGSETLTNKTLTSPTINSGSLGASSTATTQPAGDNSTKVATTAYVDANYPKNRASGYIAGLTAAATLTSYTVGASDAPFTVSANILVTSSTTHSFTPQCTYTDESNTVRVLNLTTLTTPGTFNIQITNTGGAIPYHSPTYHIRAKAGTTITIATSGTFTSVVYNGGGLIVQEAAN